MDRVGVTFFGLSLAAGKVNLELGKSCCGSR
jgi:hypothetical protein